MSDLFPNAPRAVPIALQIECAERELALRRQVYPRRIADGKMTQELADREISRMTGVLETLKSVELQRDKLAGGKYSPREGWTVRVNGEEVFRGEAGEALLEFDNRIHEASDGQLQLLTPAGNSISMWLWPRAE